MNFNLCKYFKHFGRVRVTVHSVESVDKLNLLFSHCKYCNDVRLVNCKLIGDLELDLLIKQLKDDDTRMEMLLIRNCEFDEINWMNMIQIIVNIERVDLTMEMMEEEEWERFIDVMEQRREAIKLEKLKFWDCNISDHLVERVRRFNYLWFYDEF